MQSLTSSCLEDRLRIMFDEPNFNKSKLLSRLKILNPTSNTKNNSKDKQSPSSLENKSMVKNKKHKESEGLEQIPNIKSKAVDRESKSNRRSKSFIHNECADRYYGNTNVKYECKDVQELLIATKDKPEGKRISKSCDVSERSENQSSWRKYIYWMNFYWNRFYKPFKKIFLQLQRVENMSYVAHQENNKSGKNAQSFKSGQVLLSKPSTGYNQESLVSDNAMQNKTKIEDKEFANDIDPHIDQLELPESNLVMFSENNQSAKPKHLEIPCIKPLGISRDLNSSDNIENKYNKLKSEYYSSRLSRHTEKKGDSKSEGLESKINSSNDMSKYLLQANPNDIITLGMSQDKKNQETSMIISSNQNKEIKVDQNKPSHHNSNITKGKQTTQAIMPEPSEPIKSITTKYKKMNRNPFDLNLTPSKYKFQLDQNQNKTANYSRYQGILAKQNLKSIRNIPFYYDKKSGLFEESESINSHIRKTYSKTRLKTENKQAIKSNRFSYNTSSTSIKKSYKPEASNHLVNFIYKNTKNNIPDDKYYALGEVNITESDTYDSQLERKKNKCKILGVFVKPVNCKSKDTSRNNSRPKTYRKELNEKDKEYYNERVNETIKKICANNFAVRNCMTERSAYDIKEKSSSVQKIKSPGKSKETIKSKVLSEPNKNRVVHKSIDIKTNANPTQTKTQEKVKPGNSRGLKISNTQRINFLSKPKVFKLDEQEQCSLTYIRADQSKIHKIENPFLYTDNTEDNMSTNIETPKFSREFDIEDFFETYLIRNSRINVFELYTFYSQYINFLHSKLSNLPRLHLKLECFEDINYIRRLNYHIKINLKKSQINPVRSSRPAYIYHKSNFQ